MLPEIRITNKQEVNLRAWLKEQKAIPLASVTMPNGELDSFGLGEGNQKFLSVRTIPNKQETEGKVIILYCDDGLGEKLEQAGIVEFSKLPQDNTVPNNSLIGSPELGHA